MPTVIEKIREAARASDAVPINWPGRGPAPIGYVEGMAVAFGRVYCNLKANDPAALVMARAAEQPNADALAHYADRFGGLGMDNGTAGFDTLRHLFMLMMGLGMRESSGQYCEGRDYSVPEHDVTALNAEAGLFQSSYDLCVADPLLPVIFAAYRAAPSGFVEVFRQGVACSPKSWKNWGAGIGTEFQKLSKECPAFAVEIAAVGLRVQRRHWGPINGKAAELRTECDELFRQIQEIVEANPGACGELAR